MVAGHTHRAPCGQAGTQPTRRIGLPCFRSRRAAAGGSHAEGRGARRPAAAPKAAPRPRGRIAAWGRRKPASAPAEADPPTGRWRSGGAAPPHPLKAGGQLAGRQPFRLRLTAGPTARQRGVRRAGCPPVELAVRGQRVGGAVLRGDTGVQPVRWRVALATIEPPGRPFQRWKVSPSTVSLLATGCKPVAGARSWPAGAARSVARPTGTLAAGPVAAPVAGNR